jgi:acyl-CoA thioesterase-2
MTAESKSYWSGGRSFDIRHVSGPVYLTIEGEHVPHQAIWVKPFDPLRPVDGLADAQRDLAALAYVCLHDSGAGATDARPALGET